MKSTLICLSLALLLSVAASEKVRFDNYKVFRVTPVDESHVQFLAGLQNVGINFWEGPSGSVGKSSDIMLAPHQQGDILTTIKSSGMKWQEYISNVQTLVDDQEVAESKADFAFTSYHRLDDIYAFLDDQAAQSPNASVVTYGQSFEKRDLRLLKISKSGETRPAIFIESNIHAREWISNAVTVYIINELLNGNDTEIRGWLDHFDFYIVPVTNPDGYEYTHTNDRSWRKTRSTTSSPLGCKGADPNRNWDHQWYTGGSSNNPCLDTFAGGKAFSEPESYLLAEYFKTIGNRVVFYFAIHSYSQLFLLPYGYTNVHIPQYNEYLTLANKAATALKTRYGTNFQSGNIVDILYAASGGSIDWVKGLYNTKLVLAAELRDTGNYGFLLPANQIVPSSLELLDALKVFIAHVKA